MLQITNGLFVLFAFIDIVSQKILVFFDDSIFLFLVLAL
jgi:hypothetical protein